MEVTFTLIEAVQNMALYDNVKGLIKALSNKKPSIRQVAAEALGKLNDPRAVEPIIKTLKDADSYVREEAARALGKLKDPSAVEPLIIALGDSSVSVRIVAAEALGNLKDPRAVEPLINSLGDYKFSGRIAVAEALGNLKDLRAVEPPIKALKNTNDNEFRRSVVIAFGKLKGTAAVKPLIVVLNRGAGSNYDEGTVCESAAWALGEIRDKRGVRPLINALSFNSKAISERVSIAAAKALKNMLGPDAVEPLIEVVGRKDKGFGQAASFLGLINDKRVLEPLVKFLNNDSWDIRRSAAYALLDILKNKPDFIEIDNLGSILNLIQTNH